MPGPAASHAQPGTALSPFAEPAESANELWQRLEARRPSPLRFVLHASRRTNAALCPCLEADLASSTCPSSYFTVTRILDPEHRVPYVTLSPIFFAAGLTIVQGLLRCNLSSQSFDLSLAGLEPWDDLWISLPLARSIASRLELLPALALILDAKSAPAWSLDEFEQGLSHNWRVPQEYVDAASYSTDAITNDGLRFGRAQLLPQGQQINTLVSRELRRRIIQQATERGKSVSFRLHQNMVRWSSQVYCVYSDIASVLQGESDPAQKETRMKALLDDLHDAVVPPTEADVLEWTQFASASCSTSEQTTYASSTSSQSRAESLLLSPLSAVELSESRSGDFTLGEKLFADRRALDADETASRLDSIVRVKVAILHNINLMSLARLSSSQQVETNAQRGSDIALTDGYARRHAPPSQIASGPTGTAASDKSEEIAQLHAKLDQLNAKLDSVLASRPSTQPHTLTSTRQPAKHQHPSQIHSRPASTQEAPKQSTHLARFIPFEPLISPTNPSLVMVFVSAAVFFIAIKLFSD